MSDQSPNRNVVDLKNAKKRSTDKHNPKKRAGANGSGDGYERALRSQKGIKGGVGGVRWFHYLQVGVLLLLVAWMMRSCGGM